MADQLNFRTVTIGPASRRIGRSYGLCTPLPEISMYGREIVQGFAESMSSWSQTAAAEAEPDFAMFLGLEDGDGHLLLRCRHLGAGSQGTVAVAQGLYIAPTAPAALRKRAHMLLQVIPRPSENAWGEEFVGIADAIPAPRQPVAAIDGLLRRSEGVFRIQIDSAISPDAALIEALESLRLDTFARVHAWTQNEMLRGFRAFDPDKFDISLAGQASSLPADPVVTISGGIANHIGPRDAWDVLFRPTRREQALADQHIHARSASWAKLNAAISALEWPEAYANAERHLIFADAAKRLSNNVASNDEVFDLLEILAARIAAIPPDQLADAEAASLGLATLFERTEGDKAWLAKFLEQWVTKIHPHLNLAMAQPLDHAIQHGLLSEVSPEALSSLIPDQADEHIFAALLNWLESAASNSLQSQERVFPVVLERIKALWQSNRAASDAVLEKLAEKASNRTRHDAISDDLALAIFNARHNFAKAAGDAEPVLATGRELVELLLRPGRSSALLDRFDAALQELREAIASLEASGFSKAFMPRIDGKSAVSLAALRIATLEPEDCLA